MGGLLGGGGGGCKRVCWPPLSNYLGGLPPPPLPTPMYKLDAIVWVPTSSCFFFLFFVFLLILHTKTIIVSEFAFLDYKAY